MPVGRTGAAAVRSMDAKGADMRWAPWEAIEKQLISIPGLAMNNPTLAFIAQSHLGLHIPAADAILRRSLPLPPTRSCSCPSL